MGGWGLINFYHILGVAQNFHFNSTSLAVSIQKLNCAVVNLQPKSRTFTKQNLVKPKSLGLKLKRKSQLADRQKLISQAIDIAALINAADFAVNKCQI